MLVSKLDWPSQELAIPVRGWDAIDNCVICAIKDSSD